MLTNLKEVLADARKNRYAVPAFDCVEDVMVRAILETCQEMRSPVVLMCLIGPDLDGNGWHYIPSLIKAVADFHDIPVALHLDHATDLESIRKGIEIGVTSVMIDGSTLPFEQNVEITKKTVDMAHPKGISVEGELGRVGGMDLQATVRAESTLTEPAEVEKFVITTGVDALAVSIGTAHGIYQSLPNLSSERHLRKRGLSRIHGNRNVPQDSDRSGIGAVFCPVVPDATKEFNVQLIGEFIWSYTPSVENFMTFINAIPDFITILLQLSKPFAKFIIL
jgi:fructose-bisphosphate aldolase class II